MPKDQIRMANRHEVPGRPGPLEQDQKSFGNLSPRDFQSVYETEDLVQMLSQHENKELWLFLPVFSRNMTLLKT